MGTADFDVLVLGGGSGGYACALRAAQLGLSVGLVERAKVGGTCLHAGCIPTKALLHAAEIADAARDADRFGIRATLDGVDMAGVHAYKDRVVQRLFKGLTGLIEGRGITVIEGDGALTGPREVTVDSTVYSGTHLVLATGSHASVPPGITIDGDRVLTSDEALVLDRLPDSVVVLGGGVIGCEFASVWRSFGAEVTIVEALPRLLAAEDEASSKALQRAFRKRGITVRTDVSVVDAKVVDAGVTVTLSDESTLTAEVLLVAVGRRPSSGGLDSHGVRVDDRGFVITDEHGRTAVENVYAVGDLVAGLQLAHRGFAQGIAVAELIAGLSPAPVVDDLIPRVTYCEPEVASVGLDADTARARHGDVEELSYDLAGNGRSQILATQGFIKVVRVVEGPVVGIHMVGSRVGELIGEAQLIVGWEAHPDDVAPLVHGHPTQNEALGEAHLALAGKPLHVHT
ncbi:dihydrolipoyl dehydrogenase [Nocardioides limicola]|uniref:dihydrolipoyl dehydrogenase n=1 Tax=Nocardioides limicola TaxID=2803368 RepID=UPI00193BF851|nr:dihydrolipoyl dehydrogenase [Nocardioides sp. DJM-14]